VSGGRPGLGGLRPLAPQYAGRLGYRVAAVARGSGKAELVAGLGADHCGDSSSDDPGAALRGLGDADAIIATAAGGAATSSLLPGLAAGGHVGGGARSPDGEHP
jgi:propanol-preferring alcohol dehydrogenase